jgi:hypothetical protein
VVYYLQNGSEHGVGKHHAIFRVRLKYGAGTFTLDITGAQHGHHDAVIPWDKYYAERVINMDPPSTGRKRKEISTC